MGRPANDEMLRGFRDGYDLTAPAPGPNTTASYRHGFMCGRIDKGVIKSDLTCADLRAMADAAMDYDADPWRSMSEPHGNC